MKKGWCELSGRTMRQRSTVVSGFQGDKAWFVRNWNGTGQRYLGMSSKFVPAEKKEETSLLVSHLPRRQSGLRNSGKVDDGALM